MAVMRHSITFGGFNSADYGVYIGGEGTFNAPKRDVEMISIPGRNGAFALDKGRFENIEVKYTVINQEADLATFSAQLEAFRNAICSLRGYQRLEDTFHTDEYRMAAFVDDFEVKPIEYNTAAEFEIVFECMPQRFLKSGETAITVASGDTLDNPTLFEAHPLIMTEGYGKIDLNGYEIEIMPRGTIGNIQLKEKLRTSGLSGYYTFDSSLVRNGDEITIAGLPYSSPPECSVNADVDFLLAKNADAWDFSNSGTNTAYVQAMLAGDGQNWFVSTLMKVVPITFAMGVAGTFTASLQSTFTTRKGSQNGQGEVRVETTVSYDGNNRIDVSTTRSIITDTLDVLSTVDKDFNIICTTTADSSVSALGHPTYIDCEIGEVYKIEGDSVVSLNHRVDLGSKLPELSPGTNEITFDNTITDLEIVPNWWKV